MESTSIEGSISPLPLYAILKIHFPHFMDNAEIQKKCEAFLRELNVPSFIVFGWKKQDKEFGVVSALHEIPPNAAIKGMSWALNDAIGKSL